MQHSDTKRTSPATSIIPDTRQMQTGPQLGKNNHLTTRRDLWGLMCSIKRGNKTIQLLMVSFQR